MHSMRKKASLTPSSCRERFVGRWFCIRDAPLDFKGGEQEVWVRTSFLFFFCFVLFFFLQPGREFFF